MKPHPPNNSEFRAVVADAAEAQVTMLAQIAQALTDLTTRITRIETRLCVLINHMGAGDAIRPHE